jgi:integration host factor subunit alpha
MSVTKTDLVEQVRSRCPRTTLAEAQEFVEAVFVRMKTRLAEGERVRLSGFGRFAVAHKRARRGRNPQTGEELEISARRVVVFKPSPVLTGVMNGR